MQWIFTGGISPPNALRTSSPVIFSASSRVFPCASSHRQSAETMAAKQPGVVNPIFSILLSLTVMEIFTVSPQRGLTTSPTASGFSISPEYLTFFALSRSFSKSMLVMRRGSLKIIRSKYLKTKFFLIGY